MKISSTSARFGKVIQSQIHLKAQAFGRKVAQLDVEPRMRLLKPVLNVVRTISEWIVRETGNGFEAHPIDSVFQEKPIILPGSIKEELMSFLHNPYQTMRYDENGIAEQYTNDVFRQNMFFRTVNEYSDEQTFFDSQDYYKKRSSGKNDTELKEQANKKLAEFAGHYPPLIKTLSSLANQSSQAEPIIALRNLAKEKLGEKEDVIFGETSFVDCHLTKQSDGSFEVEKYYDLTKAHYHSGDGQVTELGGASALIRIDYKVSAEGKIMEANPTIHVTWPRLQKGVKQGKVI